MALRMAGVGLVTVSLRRSIINLLTPHCGADHRFVWSVKVADDKKRSSAPRAFESSQELLKNFVRHHDTTRGQAKIAVSALQNSVGKEVVEGGAESRPVFVVGSDAFGKPKPHEEFFFAGIGCGLLTSQ